MAGMKMNNKECTKKQKSYSANRKKQILMIIFIHGCIHTGRKREANSLAGMEKNVENG